MAGKRQSSRNAISHGLFCNDLVLKGESHELFEEMRNRLLVELSPQTLLELMICDRIVTAQWKLRRLNTVELMTHDTNAQSTVINHIHESDKAQMRKQQEQQEDAEEEMEEKLTRVSQILRSPWPQKLDGMCDLMEEFKEYISPEQAISKSFLENDGVMERLSRYEQRLELSIHRNKRELDKQKKRTHDRRENGKLHCPFVSQEFYDGLHSEIREYEAELNGENEPTDEEPEPAEELTTKSTEDTKKSKANDSEADSKDSREVVEQNVAEINEKSTESTGCHERSLRYNPPPRSDV
ncbi:MAG: hypothetical protein H7Z14_02295 [Anaerolineae bacterium]|nr:hypothetical protein [Phycisphaerae bacterium]